MSKYSKINKFFNFKKNLNKSREKKDIFGNKKRSVGSKTEKSDPKNRAKSIGQEAKSKSKKSIFKRILKKDEVYTRPLKQFFDEQSKAQSEQKKTTLESIRSQSSFKTINNENDFYKAADKYVDKFVDNVLDNVSDHNKSTFKLLIKKEINEKKENIKNEDLNIFCYEQVNKIRNIRFNEEQKKRFPELDLGKVAKFKEPIPKLKLHM